MKKGLQKLTKPEDKFNVLMKKEKLEYSEIDAVLTNEEREVFFSQFLAKKLNELKSDERDKFIEQISGVISPSVKNQL